MRLFTLAVLGLIFGYVVGVGLAIVAGVVGTALLGEVSGIRFVAIGTALACAVAVPVLDARRARRSANER